MLSNNARDDLTGRVIIDVGVCPQNICASSFFPHCVSAACFVHPVPVDNIDIPSMLGAEHYLGPLNMSTTEKQLNPSKCTRFFMPFSFFLHSFPVFPPHSHFYVQILQYPLQEFTSDSSSVLPQCLRQSLLLCLCGKQLLVMVLELSVIIYENCELPSLFRCFPYDFIWLNTERHFEKAGRNRKDLLKMAVFACVSQGE